MSTGTAFSRQMEEGTGGGAGATTKSHEIHANTAAGNEDTSTAFSFAPISHAVFRNVSEGRDSGRTAQEGFALHYNTVQDTTSSVKHCSDANGTIIHVFENVGIEDAIKIMLPANGVYDEVINPTRYHEVISVRGDQVKKCTCKKPFLQLHGPKNQVKSVPTNHTPNQLRSKYIPIVERYVEVVHGVRRSKREQESSLAAGQALSAPVPAPPGPILSVHAGERGIGDKDQAAPSPPPCGGGAATGQEEGLLRGGKRAKSQEVGIVQSDDLQRVLRKWGWTSHFLVLFMQSQVCNCTLYPRQIDMLRSEIKGLIEDATDPVELRGHLAKRMKESFFPYLPASSFAVPELSLPVKCQTITAIDITIRKYLTNHDFELKLWQARFDRIANKEPHDFYEGVNDFFEPFELRAEAMAPSNSHGIFWSCPDWLVQLTMDIIHLHPGVKKELCGLGYRLFTRFQPPLESIGSSDCCLRMSSAQADRPGSICGYNINKCPAWIGKAPSEEQSSLVAQLSHRYHSQMDPTRRGENGTRASRRYFYVTCNTETEISSFHQWW